MTVRREVLIERKRRATTARLIEELKRGGKTDRKAAKKAEKVLR